MLISVIDHQPTSQKYFNDLFFNIELSWKEIYLLQLNRLLTVTYVASIMKLLTMCFIWIRSFFNSAIQLLLFFETDLHFLDLTPQAALFGFINELCKNLNMLQSYILLIFKLYIYQSREREVLNLNSLIKNFSKVKKLERKFASVCKKKTIQFNTKLKSTDLKITV